MIGFGFVNSAGSLRFDGFCFLFRAVFRHTLVFNRFFSFSLFIGGWKKLGREKRKEKFTAVVLFRKGNRRWNELRHVVAIMAAVSCHIWCLWRVAIMACDGRA